MVAQQPRHSREHIHAPMTFGERAADAVVSGMGSWRFIILQAAVVVCWLIANGWLLTRPFDPMPFILLNLAFSTQASFAAPLLQLSNNRQSQKDRLRDDHEAAEVHLLYRINRQQLLLLALWPLLALGLGFLLMRARRRGSHRTASHR